VFRVLQRCYRSGNVAAGGRTVFEELRRYFRICYTVANPGTLPNTLQHRSTGDIFKKTSDLTAPIVRTCRSPRINKGGPPTSRHRPC